MTSPPSPNKSYWNSRGMPIQTSNSLDKKLITYKLFWQKIPICILIHEVCTLFRVRAIGLNILFLIPISCAIFVSIPKDHQIETVAIVEARGVYFKLYVCFASPNNSRTVLRSFFASHFLFQRFAECWYSFQGWPAFQIPSQTGCKFSLIFQYYDNCAKWKPHWWISELLPPPAFVEILILVSEWEKKSTKTKSEQIRVN